MVVDSTLQRIARLTPLSAILASIQSHVRATPPRRCAISAAQGGTLAEDVVTTALPAQAIALRDGVAVEAAMIADAGAYAPMPLPTEIRHIEVGDPLPDKADAVLPLDAISLRGKHVEATAAVTPGEGVLPAGGDTAPRTPLRWTGQRLRPIDLAVLTAAGIKEAMIRSPCVAIVHGGAVGSVITDAALDMLVHAISQAGARVLDLRKDRRKLDAALTDATADAVIAVGGTGSGRRDTAVQTLARLGHVEAHGIAVSPGETAAFGFVGERPVLLAPGRLDAVLAAWLLIGRPVVATLVGSKLDDAPAMLPLRRKVTSAIGLTELVPVRCAGGMAEPLASGYLSLAVLAQSDGWIVIPADSEGFAGGTPVAVRPWP
jgi:molybdopterin biosynthesis enzyme